MNEATKELVRRHGHTPSEFDGTRCMFFVNEDYAYFAIQGKDSKFCKVSANASNCKLVTNKALIDEVKFFIEDHCRVEFTKQSISVHDIYEKYIESCGQYHHPIDKRIFGKVFLDIAFRREKLPGIMISKYSTPVKTPGEKTRYYAVYHYLNLVLV